MTQLADKVAIVTGSSRGIGKVVALQLASDGAKVVVCGRTENPSDESLGSVEETTDAIRAAGGTALPLRIDVTEDDDLQALVDKTHAEFGRIDILVNNAGALGGGGSFIDGDPALLDHFYRTNLRAPYVLAQLVSAKMSESGGGVIFNISSGLARLPSADRTQAGSRGGPGVVYGTSKAALDRFAAGVAPELKEKDIAIINVYPGFTLTERLAQMMQGADTSRMERPETTAKAISFLCRDPMAFTGEIVVARDLASREKL